MVCVHSMFRRHHHVLTANVFRCEYIFYRGLYRTSYARISRGIITDTETQIGQFVVPAPGHTVVDDSEPARYRRSRKEVLPIEHVSLPYTLLSGYPHEFVISPGSGSQWNTMEMTRKEVSMDTIIMYLERSAFLPSSYPHSTDALHPMDSLCIINFLKVLLYERCNHSALLEIYLSTRTHLAGVCMYHVYYPYLAPWMYL